MDKKRPNWDSLRFAGLSGNGPFGFLGMKRPVQMDGNCVDRKHEPDELLSTPQKPQVGQPATSRTKGGKVPSAIRMLVWNKYVGEDTPRAKCWCCRSKTMTVFDFHCGHVVSAAGGGDATVRNLRPVCALCNGSMGTRDMNEFIRIHGLWNDNETQEVVQDGAIGTL